VSAVGNVERPLALVPSTLLTRPRALACGGAMLLAHVGIAHEVVGATLYPDGPALLGGPVGWHAVGLTGTVAGVLMVCATLRLLAMPLVPLGVLASVTGAVFVAWDAMAHQHFHFFAFTAMVAGALVVVGGREETMRRDGDG
jgi:hypothetical protein